MFRTTFAVVFITIILLGVPRIPSLCAQPSSDRYFPVKQQEFMRQFNQVANNNRLKAVLTPSISSNLDAGGCNSENQCFYNSAYGGYDVESSADERGGNIRLIFMYIRRSANIDMGVFSDSVSATIALIAPLLSKEQRETTTYMIVHSVMAQTRNDQVLNEFAWVVNFYPENILIAIGRSRNSWGSHQ